jgi:hypothetical protein
MLQEAGKMCLLRMMGWKLRMMYFKRRLDRYSPILQEPVQDICEEYDEAAHGPLDGPMVRPGVVRQRYGPPQTAEEEAEEAELMQRLKDFVSKAERGDGGAVAGSIAVRAAEPRSASAAKVAQQDEVRPMGSISSAELRSVAAVPSVPAGAGEQSGPNASGPDEIVTDENAFDAATDRDALDRELDRLAGAFDQPDTNTPLHRECVPAALEHAML